MVPPRCSYRRCRTNSCRRRDRAAPKRSCSPWCPSAGPGIGDKDIDSAPLLDDAAHHGLDCPVVADIAFDAQRGAARGLDFGDRALRGHVLRFGVELPIGFQTEVGDRDLRTESGQTPGISAAEPARRTGDDHYLAVELAHQRPSL